MFCNVCLQAHTQGDICAYTSLKTALKISALYNTPDGNKFTLNSVKPEAHICAAGLFWWHQPAHMCVAGLWWCQVAHLCSCRFLLALCERTLTSSFIYLTFLGLTVQLFSHKFFCTGYFDHFCAHYDFSAQGHICSWLCLLSYFRSFAFTQDPSVFYFHSLLFD